MGSSRLLPTIVGNKPIRHSHSPGELFRAPSVAEVSSTFCGIVRQADASIVEKAREVVPALEHVSALAILTIEDTGATRVGVAAKRRTSAIVSSSVRPNLQPAESAC